MPVATQNRITGLVSGNGSARGKAPEKDVPIAIPAPDIRLISVSLVGDSPYISHKFSAKSKRQMSDKQQGKAQLKKAPKNPKEDFEASLYPIPGRKGKYGIPASSFKQSAVSACRYTDGLSMTMAQGAFFVMGDLIEVVGPAPKMREDVVRIGGFGKKVADLRYRGEFSKWSVKLTIRYNARAITAEQIVGLLNTAGFHVGVGEWRPEKRGTFGMFHVETRK